MKPPYENEAEPTDESLMEAGQAGAEEAEAPEAQAGEVSDDFKMQVANLLTDATPAQLEYIRSCMTEPEEEDEDMFSEEDMPKD